MKNINLIYSDKITKESQSDYLDYENINDYDYTHIDDLKNNIKYIYIEFIPGYPSYEFKEA